jgi:hypothetical protein
MKKIIVLTAVFAMVFTGAAIAADWNFYGSSRMALFFGDLGQRLRTQHHHRKRFHHHHI